TNDAGKFSITGVLPGNYTIEVRTPSLDSVNAVSESAIAFADNSTEVELRVPTGAQITTKICGPGRLPSPGIIVGVVTNRGDTTPQRNAAVSVEWTGLSIQNDAVEKSRYSRDAKTDSTGSFRVCGVPVNTALI